MNEAILKSDSHTRSFMKAISWRFLATLTTITISYLVTKHIMYALSIGAIEVVSKILLYYLHERIWNNIARR